MFLKWMLFYLFLCVWMPSEVWAGAWTLKKGDFWAKIALMMQATNEEYVAVGGSGREPDFFRIYEPGDRARYRENGQYDSRAVFLIYFMG